MLPTDSIPQDSTTVYLPYVMLPDSAAETSWQSSCLWTADSVKPGSKSVVGVMGAPHSYKVGADNAISVSVMVMVVVAMLALSASWGFVVRQGRNLFYRENDRTTTVPDTKKELNSQLILVAFTAFILAVMYFACTSANASKALSNLANFSLPLYIMAFVGYFLFKAAFYQLVNWVFFDGKEIEQWNKSQLFLTAMEGLLVSPIILFYIYGKLPLYIALICVGFVVILCKILTFYKCYLIFFRRIGAFLQIFLYFCALELIPLAILVGILEASNENLNINF